MKVDPAVSLELAASSQQQVVNEIILRGDSDIQRFYNNATIFITGGTGFLGKQLIEKLLRACNTFKIYILLRPKKGMDIQTRLANLLQDTVFESVRKQKPDFAAKIVALNGDASNKRLGLCQEDWETLKIEVDIIFHLAATTRFDENLKVATLINVRGTRETITLAKNCKMLRSFVHVSTAYSHATEKMINAEVDEKFYSCPIPPETLISLAENVEESRIISITANLIKDWPNTYTFTKAVAEEAVRIMSDGLPICIVKPAIVLGSYREPSPGWVDPSNVYGASGEEEERVNRITCGSNPLELSEERFTTLFRISKEIALALIQAIEADVRRTRAHGLPVHVIILTGLVVGVMHVMLNNDNVHAGYIPCDYTNNAIIVAARETATNQAKGGDDTRIYTISSLRNPVSFEIINKHMIEARDMIPSPSAVYYNYSYMTDKRKLFFLMTFFLHTIPAYFLDSMCFLLGKKRMFVKLYTKMHKMIGVLSYFTLNEWKFTDRNLDKLFANLRDDDKTIFNFNVESIDWKECIFIWILGVRRYIIKDGLKDADYASKKQFWLRMLHYISYPIYFYGI